MSEANQQPEWMLTDRQLLTTLYSVSDHKDRRRAIALAQARTLVEWKGRACHMHHSQWQSLVWRRECAECMAQLHKDVGLE